MRVKSADGLAGCLIYCGDQVYRFRVYEDDGSFKDYDLLHSDLSVVIQDKDAYLYDDYGGTAKLDHSPETLGVTK